MSTALRVSGVSDCYFSSLNASRCVPGHGALLDRIEMLRHVLRLNNAGFDRWTDGHWQKRIVDKRLPNVEPEVHVCRLSRFSYKHTRARSGNDC
jgi:hypothetical protein